jgi:molybdenum cofactor biosynthesis enzyme MoaA
MKLEDIDFLEVIDERAKNIKHGKISYCEWIITSNCNFNCPYCNRLEPRQIPDLSLAQIKDYIQILANMDCKYVHLTGGEVTVRKDLVEIIQALKNAGIRVGLSTNGSRSFYYYQNLIDNGLELISMSLDVHQKDLNKKFTMVLDNVFDTVVNNIRELSKQIYVNVGVVFNDDNIKLYKDILNFISELGANDIRIMTSTKYNEIVKFDVSDQLLSKHPILKFRVKNFNEGLNMRGSDLSDTSKCHLVRDDLTIFGEDYYPCAVYIREKGNPIGKFSENNVHEREEWFKNHNSHKDPICQQFCMDFKCRFNDKIEKSLI